MAFKSYNTNVTIKQPFVPDWVFNENPVSFDDYMKQQLVMDATKAENEKRQNELEKQNNLQKESQDLTKLYSDYENSDKSKPITEDDVNSLFLKYGDIEGYKANKASQFKQEQEKSKAIESDIKDAMNLASKNPDLAAAYWDLAKISERSGKPKPEFKANRYVSGQGLVQYDDNGGFKVLVPPQENPNGSGKNKPVTLFDSSNTPIVINGNDMGAVEDATRKGFIYRNPRDSMEMRFDSANNQQPEATPTPTTVDGGSFTKSLGNLISRAAGSQTMPEPVGTKILRIKKKQ